MLSLSLAVVEGQKVKVHLDRIATGMVDPPRDWFTDDEWVAYQFQQFQNKNSR